MPDAELDALRERARRFRPIPVPFHDSGQCLQHALAECLRIPPGQVPARCDHQELDEWDRMVKERLGVRLELIDRDEPPPNEPWIAIVGGHNDQPTHALAVFGNAAAAGRTAGWLPDPPRMNKTDPALQRGKRTLKAAQAYLADLLLEEMSLVERIEADALLEDGVATSREIHEGLGLDVPEDELLRRRA